MLQNVTLFRKFILFLLELSFVVVVAVVLVLCAMQTMHIRCQLQERDRKIRYNMFVYLVN